MFLQVIPIPKEQYVFFAGTDAPFIQPLPRLSAKINHILSPRPSQIPPKCDTVWFAHPNSPKPSGVLPPPKKKTCWFQLNNVPFQPKNVNPKYIIRNSGKAAFLHSLIFLLKVRQKDFRRIFFFGQNSQGIGAEVLKATFGGHWLCLTLLSLQLLSTDAFLGSQSRNLGSGVPPCCFWYSSGGGGS